MRGEIINTGTECLYSFDRETFEKAFVQFLKRPFYSLHVSLRTLWPPYFTAKATRHELTMFQSSCMRYLLVVQQQYGQYQTCHAMTVSSSMQYCNRNRNQGNNWIGNKIICTSQQYIRIRDTYARTQFSHFNCPHCVGSPSPIDEYNFQTNKSKTEKKTIFRYAIGKQM